MSAQLPSGSGVRLERDDLIIFISYRRSDTRADAGRLYDALRRRFGKDQLFKDVDSLLPGDDFVKAIDNAIERSDVILALIGADWVSVRDRDGSLRLENEMDRVRLEIASAFALDKRVIPVLFDDAVMPRAADLPEPLKPLARREAVRIQHDAFHVGLDKLVRQLRSLEKTKAEERRQTDAVEEARLAAEAEQRRREAQAAEEARLAAEAEQRRREAEAAEKAVNAASAGRGTGLDTVTGLPASTDMIPRRVDADSAPPLEPEFSRGVNETVENDSPHGPTVTVPSRPRKRFVTRGLLVAAGVVAVVAAAAILAFPKPGPLVGLLPTPEWSVAQHMLCEGESVRVSPSGNYKLQTCEESETSSSFDLFLRGPDGILRNVTNNPGNSDYLPDWHPFDDKFLYEGGPSGESNIYLYEAESGQKTRLTDPPALDGWPEWSPDGVLIAFQRYSGPSSQNDIWVMDANGQNQRAVVSGPGDDQNPGWRSDDELEFTRYGDSEWSDWYVSLDGSNLREIATHTLSP